MEMPADWPVFLQKIVRDHMREARAELSLGGSRNVIRGHVDDIMEEVSDHRHLLEKHAARSFRLRLADEQVEAEIEGFMQRALRFC